MKVAIIGRAEVLFETAEMLRKQRYEIALIITAKEAPEYTKTSTDFKKLADDWGAPFLHTPRIIEAVNMIQSCGTIDIGVSVNYSEVIPKTITDLFPLGILNAHGGDLPRYRGNACQAWAILNGEERIGLCIHRMIGGELDSGDIITRDYFPIDLNTKVTAIHQWMGERIPALFLDALQHLQRDPKYVLETQSKQPNDVLRCYPRKPEDGRIDWNKSVVEILRLINACNKPYAGAFCEFENEKVIVWEAEIAPVERFLAVSGQVIAIGDGYIEVATGKGKLRINEIEIGAKQISPDQRLKSIRSRLY